MIFVENVYSPILAKVSHEMGIKNILLSGLIREQTKDHPIYRRAFGLQFEKYIDHFYVKSDLDIPLLSDRGIGDEHITVSGNLKYSDSKNDITNI